MCSRTSGRLGCQPLLGGSRRSHAALMPSEGRNPLADRCHFASILVYNMTTGSPVIEVVILGPADSVSLGLLHFLDTVGELSRSALHVAKRITSHHHQEDRTDCTHGDRLATDFANVTATVWTQLSRPQKKTPAASSTPAETSKGDAKGKQAGHLQLHTSLSQSWNALQVDFGCNCLCQCHDLCCRRPERWSQMFCCWPLRHLNQPLSHHFEWHNEGPGVSWLSPQLWIGPDYSTSDGRPVQAKSMSFVIFLQKR